MANRKGHIMAMYSQISYWAFRGQGIVQAMEMAKEAGFAGIELAVGDSGGLTTASTPADCRMLADVAKKAKLKLGSVASGMLWGANPASKDKATRERAIELTDECLRVTADLGCGHLLILSGHVDVFFQPDGEVVPYADCYERSVVFLKAVAKLAKKHGVVACVENVWNRFLCSPLEFRQLLREIRSDYVQMYFDVGNVWAFGYPQHWISVMDKYIARVHVKDFRRSVGHAGGFCKLGAGDVPLKESLRLLKKIKYNGPVTAEVGPGKDDTDDRAFLRETAAKLEELLP